MKSISLNWTDFKTNLINRKGSIQFYTEDNHYRIFFLDGQIEFTTSIENEDPKSSHQIDFEDNYLSVANSKLSDSDNDARSIIRVAAADKGAAYKAHFFEFETCLLDSVHCESWLGMSDMDFSIKFFKMDGTELLTQNDIDTMCTKTVVTFKPMYDYELVSGNVHMISRPTEDLRLWVVGGAPELGDMGAKEFIRNLNLQYIGADEGLHTDGRASKFMAASTMGVPYNTNQLQIVIKSSSVGYKHKILMAFEYFRK